MFYDDELSGLFARPYSPLLDFSILIFFRLIFLSNVALYTIASFVFHVVTMRLNGRQKQPAVVADPSYGNP